MNKALLRMVLILLAVLTLDGCEALGLKKKTCYICTTQVFNSGAQTSTKDSEICDQSQMEFYKKANQFNSGTMQVVTTCKNK